MSLMPVLRVPQVNAAALLCVSLCYTENVLCESGKLPLEGRTLLEALKGRILFLFPLVAKLIGVLLFKGTVLPECVSGLLRNVLLCVRV